ncbi:nitrite reductase (NAD(P)H) small subunit [Mycobacterium sp. Y57]|uniref:Rieske (2Fe-2S) protein n=1 Tax=Mycolicibacterium xanthum TaxID=2796469 RepID=UPI001C851004|nr:Rieske 2Fe-2S domain-containing protein [Mycolicibacterium xanthum]MBX7435195.1 nitrite reductase (NAD(P)H) small subunit [Mycolicibacterium xanthum]
MSDVEVGVELGSLDEVPVGEGRTFAVDGAQIAVFRLRDGSLRAIDAVCPHKGGPLADGLADDRVVVCPLHGYTFDMCSGAEVSGSGLSVRSYPVEAVDGMIRINR